MTRQHRSLCCITAVTLLAAISCSRSDGPSSNDDFQYKRDLESASSSALDLAPRGGHRTEVTSAREQNIPNRRGAPGRGPAQTARESGVAAAAATPVPPDTDPTAADTAPVAPRPHPPQPPDHHGRYKTMGQVIREAPFPINP
jgi:hypothetical protein